MAADIDIPAESLPASRQIITIPLTNPLFPLRLDIAAIPGDHISMTLADSFGTNLWSYQFIPRGGGKMLDALDDDDDH